MRISGLLALLALAGCDRVFGLPAFTRDAPTTLEDTHRPSPDAAPDSTTIDASLDIVIEAERGMEAQGPNGHNWTQVDDASASGGHFMQVEPDNHISCVDDTMVASCATQLAFPVTITTPGNYYVQVRMFATSNADASLWYGIAGVATSVPLTQLTYGVWSWVVGGAFVLNPGSHMLTLWQRQTGARADAIALTLSPTPL